MSIKERVSSSTFMCWLIANFEVILFWITLIISVGLLWTPLTLEFEQHRLDTLQVSDFSNFVRFLFAWGIGLAAITLPSKNGGIGIGKFLIVLGLLILLGYMSNTGEIEGLLMRVIIYLYLFFTFCIVIGIFFAVITYDNIDEIASRRMLYRNSNVDLFEVTWKYTLDRFCNITISTFCCILSIIAAFYLYFNPEIIQPK